MDIMEIKNKTTKELKDFSKRIDEEIKFREEVGREIDKRKEKIHSRTNRYMRYVDESGCL